MYTHTHTEETCTLLMFQISVSLSLKMHIQYNEEVNSSYLLKYSYKSGDKHSKYLSNINILNKISAIKYNKIHQSNT